MRPAVLWFAFLDKLHTEMGEWSFQMTMIKLSTHVSMIIAEKLKVNRLNEILRAVIESWRGVVYGGKI